MEIQRPIIKLDSLMIGKGDNRYPTRSVKKIEAELNAYYQDSFRRRNTKPELLTGEWEKEYKLKLYVKPEIYEPVTILPMLEELELTLRDLPNEKASGPSGVANKMLKKLGTQTKQLLRHVFGIILLIGAYPSEWCYSCIFSIAKPKPWNL